MSHEFSCPRCAGKVGCDDFLIPGLWVMGSGMCGGCGDRWLCDLPYGVAAMAPCLIHRESGKTIRPDGPEWYRALTEKAYGKPSSRDTGLRVIKYHEATSINLINCLIPWWGDVASLLLRINQLDDGLDTVVLAPPGLVELIPKSVAEIWVVEQPLSASTEWNRDLDQRIHEQVRRFEACFVPLVFQPAFHPAGETIEFTGVPIFPRQEWSERLGGAEVTFLWREDRCWTGLGERLRVKVPRRLPGARLFNGFIERLWKARNVRRQRLLVCGLAEEIRRQFSPVKFTVTGLGKSGSFPAWIADQRTLSIGPGTNLEWCRQAAKSHVLITVLGSHAVLPSAHAGAVLDLVPNGMLRCVMTDIILTTAEARKAVYLYRLLPLDISVKSLASITTSILFNFGYVSIAQGMDYYGEKSPEQLAEIREALKKRTQSLVNAGIDLRRPEVGP